MTYDTTGQDWTIRLWDLNKGDCLISSFTCPSRILSLDVNIEPFVNTHTNNIDNSAMSLNGAVTVLNNINLSICDDNHDLLLIAVSLYAFKSLLILKLTNGTINNNDGQNDSINNCDLNDSKMIERNINL